jgi:type VII secretion protein EssC, C-terminal domain
MNFIILRQNGGYSEYPVKEEGILKIGEIEIDTNEIQSYKWESVNENIQIFYIKENKVRLDKADIITISAKTGEIVVENLPLSMLLKGNKLFIESMDSGNVNIVYNMQEFVMENIGNCIEVSIGDSLLIGNIRLTIFEKSIELEAEEGTYKTTLTKSVGEVNLFEDFPKYRRSPRIIKNVPDTKVAIESPPEEKNMDKGSIAQIIITPLATLSVTVAMSILMKRGIYVIMSVATTLLTLTMSVSKLIKEKKACKEFNEKREQMYEDYLLGKRKEISELYEEEKDTYSYNHPSINQIEKIVTEYSSRIYERNANDGDFLAFKVGNVSELASFKIEVGDKELSMEEDELEKEALEIKKYFSKIDNKPIIVDLKKAHLGIVGDKVNVHEQLKLIISRLTSFHSYHELQFIAIYNDKYKTEFEYLKWYPHFKIQALNIYGSIHSERVRDQVLGSINQILKERKTNKEESRKSSRFLPHFIFIIDEPKLIMDHSIMEYLNTVDMELGFSVIYTTHLRDNLPENIATIVKLDNSETGTLILDNKLMVNKKFNLDHIGNVNIEKMARDLSVLVHEQGVVSKMPEAITFFEMYKVNTPKQLDIKRRWAESNSHKSLAVPLGVRATDDYVMLNLHEKAHGPHGLVAGTTGSGKSEIVQSYIMSLAVNFHPHEVGFLLIDYKGGGMAGLFKNLPHLLGTITNLDGSESMRAMASIKSELERRQRIFSEYEVNHINGYNQLFKNGTAKEPMPHLFLISDEFAELKKEQPDFMKELVSAARIGRSLGIHLILATQKPSGVVDDQIWTNSKFKLALKVQNEADSREMLKTGDAANITQPGRAYLQVGNNEIYELFQSAWSGASYSDDKTEEKADDRVYLINELGQGELLNQDLGGSSESNKIKKTQLDVVVDYIKEVYEENKGAEVKKPWLPPLKQLIQAPCLITPKRAGELDLKLSLGMIDIPEEQTQCEYIIDIAKDGNILYIASSGFGKSVFLAASILSLAAKNTVENLNIYILDFGNSALIPLNNLPHTSEYITIDSEELQQKFIEHMNNEVTKRKKLLAGLMVQNFEVYNQMAQEPLKAIVIVVDNFDVVKEQGYDTEAFYSNLSRDGVGLGIYLIITATRTGGIRPATMNNFKNKIAGYIFEQSEVTGIVGRSTYKPSEIKGRAMVKYDSRVSMMQIYTAIIFGSDVEYTQKIKAKIEEIKDIYVGEKATRIAMLPEEFKSAMMKDYESETADIYLGLDKKSVKLIGFNSDSTPFVIIGDTAKGKTNILKVMLWQILKRRKDERKGVDSKTYIFDSSTMELYDYKDNEYISYVENEENLDLFISEMTEIVENRNQKFKEMMIQSKGQSPKAIYGQMEKLYVIIDDADVFIALSKDKAAVVLNLLKDMAGVGISIIITVNSTRFKGFDDISKYIKSAVDGLVVGSQGSASIFSIGNMPKDQVAFGDGAIFAGGKVNRVRLPKFSE